MLRNFGTSSIICLMSQLLVIVQQCAYSVECKNIENNDVGLCKLRTFVLANEGYTYAHGDSAYKFYGKPQKWNAARKICEEDGSHLPIIDTDHERQVLLDLMELHMVKLRAVEGTPSTDRHVWLGIHDLFQEGEWNNVLGEPIGYAPWANKSADCFRTKQPDNGAGRGQDCGALVANNCGYMDDLKCSWILPFFCEKPVKEC